MIKQTISEGVPAKYVLFDSWFSSPKMFWQLKQLGLDSVGMLKQTKKVYYRYRGRLYDVKGLYERLAASKMHQKADYLYSSVVEAEYQGHAFPIRLVYVTKRGSKGKYLVLATTQYKLHPQEIIRKQNSSKNISYVNNVDTANIMCKSALGITIGPSFILEKENAFVKPVPLEYRVKLSYGTASLNSNHKIQIKDFYNFFKLNLQ